MNEGEYLLLCNDLKLQYDAMKNKYRKQIAMLKHTIRQLKQELKGSYQYVAGQFDSPRPCARDAMYTVEPDIGWRTCRCGAVCVKNNCCVFCEI